MNKREVRKLKASFIMIGGVFSASHFNNWGVDWKFALPLGIGSFIIFWLIIEKIFP